MFIGRCGHWHYDFIGQDHDCDEVIRQENELYKKELELDAAMNRELLSRLKAMRQAMEENFKEAQRIIDARGLSKDRAKTAKSQFISDTNDLLKAFVLAFTP